MSEPYVGEPKLVLTLDLGTTSSAYSMTPPALLRLIHPGRSAAVSIVHLQPGVPPTVGPSHQLLWSASRVEGLLIRNPHQLQVRSVSRWPGDSISSKVPSLILCESPGLASLPRSVCGGHGPGIMPHLEHQLTRRLDFERQLCASRLRVRLRSTRRSDPRDGRGGGLVRSQVVEAAPAPRVARRN